MTRPNAYLGKTTDLLSALFLLLAIVLGGQGPLAAQAAAAPQSLTDLGGSPAHRSKPFVTKQQFLVTEARDAKATAWDDGKAKALLQSTGFVPAIVSAGLLYGMQLVGLVPRAASSGFQARAPPFQS